MSNCASCKHWLKITKDWKEAQYHPFTIGRGFCQFVEFDSDDWEGREQSIAYIHGYDVDGLITKPEFGCNQWEGKEDAAKQE